MNVNLPRQPRMPWTKAWTPLFDAGVKWVRIGQYESSSDQVSWDWVEQTAGHYAVPEGAEEAIRSLRENGVSIETQLQYSNPSIPKTNRNVPTALRLPGRESESARVMTL